MASTKLVLSFIITFFLIFLLLPSHAASHSDSQMVNLSVYYEALSPSCATFIVQNLARIFDDDLITITNLRMVPWGNARVNKTDSTIICQNGRDECFLHKLQACAINVWNDVVGPPLCSSIAIITLCICSELIAGRKITLNEWVNCFGMSGLGKAPVDCYTRGYGEVLEKKYAAETAKLNPPHRFVPWVVVNNQPLREDFENFVSYVCKAYRGTKMPEACKSLPRENNSLRKENRINSVCFVDQTSNLTSSAPVIN